MGWLIKSTYRPYFGCRFSVWETNKQKKTPHPETESPVGIREQERNTISRYSRVLLSSLGNVFCCLRSQLRLIYLFSKLPIPLKKKKKEKEKHDAKKNYQEGLSL